MSTTQNTIGSTFAQRPTVLDRAQLLAERLDAQFLGAAELLTVEIGRRLGLYAALARLGQVTAAELADATGIARGYAVEWLDQQAAAGYVDVAGSDVPTRQPRFVLSSGHAAALLDPESPAYPAE